MAGSRMDPESFTDGGSMDGLMVDKSRAVVIASATTSSNGEEGRMRDGL